MYAHSFINAGGMLVNLANMGKQYNFLDNLGSVRVTIDAEGIHGYDYKPFGDTLMADGENRIGFAAQERDEESRYFAMGARQYDCLSGRFLSLDPLMDKFPEQSPYSYANNNPISFKDPTGLEPEGEKGKDEVQTQVGITEEQYYGAYLAFRSFNDEINSYRKM
jgi:RHS repeat-associated protein